MKIPCSDSKITSAVWGPLGEFIIVGHENGELNQFGAKVRVRGNGVGSATVKKQIILRSVWGSARENSSQPATADSVSFCVVKVRLV